MCACRVAAGGVEPRGGRAPARGGAGTEAQGGAVGRLWGRAACLGGGGAQGRGYCQPTDGDPGRSGLAGARTATACSPQPCSRCCGRGGLRPTPGDRTRVDAVASVFCPNCAAGLLRPPVCDTPQAVGQSIEDMDGHGGLTPLSVGGRTNRRGPFPNPFCFPSGRSLQTTARGPRPSR